MAKPPAPESIAAALTVPERVFFVLLGDEHRLAESRCTDATAQQMIVRELVDWTATGFG